MMRRVILFFIFTLTFAFSMHSSLPQQQICEKIIALARSAMVMMNSVNKTQNSKLDFVTNFARCLNSIPGNYCRINGKIIMISPAEKAAQLSFLVSMVADIIKPEKLINGKVTPAKQRTNARRAILMLLAIVESVAVIWESFRCVNGPSSMSEATSKMLRDTSAFASVLHSIAANDDKYSKVVHAGILVIMLYDCIKIKIFDLAEKSHHPELEKLKIKIMEQEILETQDVGTLVDFIADEFGNYFIGHAKKDKSTGVVSQNEAVPWIQLDKNGRLTHIWGYKTDSEGRAKYGWIDVEINLEKLAYEFKGYPHHHTLKVIDQAYVREENPLLVPLTVFLQQASA